MCIATPTHRTPTRSSGGNPCSTNDCPGIYTFDFNAWIQGANDPELLVCQAVDAQYWSRDPASASRTGLSDAVKFVINP